MTLWPNMEHGAKYTDSANTEISWPNKEIIITEYGIMTKYGNATKYGNKIKYTNLA